jgi:phosphatidylserine/phosphatidylglycerophosphate/cardiolipin synthase-like enzyme
MSTSTPHPSTPHTVEVRTCVSPQDDTVGAFKEFISSARASIRITLFSFTLENVAAILAEKARAKIPVQLMMDRTQAGSAESRKLIQDLEQAGVRIQLGISPMPAGAPPIDDKRRVLHIKSTIVDEEAVWDGSWNHSKSTSAEANTANLVRDPARARWFAAFFDLLWKNMADLEVVLVGDKLPTQTPGQAGGSSSAA